ncbi:hypothetical protein ACKF11_08960 [Methylobacillus sp. Pita2]|uniref:hypothetical protein n=1 Tax=Methylobacillus sp. Pita2 TaxID=3383245 RepID=UPI0038B46F93
MVAFFIAQHQAKKQLEIAQEQTDKQIQAMRENTAQQITHAQEQTAQNLKEERQKSHRLHLNALLAIKAEKLEISKGRLLALSGNINWLKAAFIDAEKFFNEEKSSKEKQTNVIKDIVKKFTFTSDQISQIPIHELYLSQVIKETSKVIFDISHSTSQFNKENWTPSENDYSPKPYKLFAEFMQSFSNKINDMIIIVDEKIKDIEAKQDTENHN